MTDAEFGRLPAAWIMAREAVAVPSSEDLRAFCRARLAGYKVPVAFHWTDELPRSPAGKLLRARLG